MKVDPSAIWPLRNVVLIELVESESVTEGGIHLPETSRKSEDRNRKIGRVLRVGPGKLDDDKGPSRGCLVRCDDVVIFDPPYAAAVRGHDNLFLIEDDAILATYGPRGDA